MSRMQKNTEQYGAVFFCMEKMILSRKKRQLFVHKTVLMKTYLIPTTEKNIKRNKKNKKTH